MFRTQTRITVTQVSNIQGLALFLADIGRIACCVIFPALFYFLGEKLACLADAQYAHEILVPIILIDVILTATVMLPGFWRYGKRILRWVLSEDAGFKEYK